jgi:hypothetical protein
MLNDRTSHTAQRCNQSQLDFVQPNRSACISGWFGMKERPCRKFGDDAGPKVPARLPN